MGFDKKIKPFGIFVGIIVITIILYYIYLEYTIRQQDNAEQTRNMYADINSPELIKLYELSGYNREQFDKFILTIIDSDNENSLKKKKNKLLEGISSTIFSSMVICIINGQYHSPTLVLSAIVNNLTSLLTKVFF
jgi:predicted PurR-regulated permease PerM